MSYDNPWIYKGEIFDSEHINNAHGFIYVIEEISTGRIYIGQKQLWTKKIRTINKKKKKVKCESDWKKYYSSSNYINEKVAEQGVSDFKRYILLLCASDGMLNYMELKLQMMACVLENESSFINGYVGGRISRSHISREKLLDVDFDLLNKILPVNTLYENSYFGLSNG